MRLAYRVHAVRRMFERAIRSEDVRFVLESGEVIEECPDDQPYPSRLVLGRHGTWPLHVVAADHTGTDETIVITAYEPDPTLWEPDFRTRKAT